MSNNSIQPTVPTSDAGSPKPTKSEERARSLRRRTKMNEILESNAFTKAYNDAISYALYCEEFVAPEVERKELSAKINGLYCGHWPMPCEEIAMKGRPAPKGEIQLNLRETLRYLQRERDNTRSITEQDDFEIESIDENMVWQTERTVLDNMLSSTTPVCHWIDPFQLLLFSVITLERNRADFEWTERTVILASTYGPAIRLEDARNTMIITPYPCPNTGERKIGDFMVPKELLKPGGAIPRFDTPRGDLLKVHE